jgi:hypothetical protein
MKRLEILTSNVPWLTAYCWQRLTRKLLRPDGAHVIFCIADHFEPAILPNRGPVRADRYEQERRLEVWCREIPKALDAWRDSEGRPFYHTYFYPAEQYEANIVERLAEHCRAGWGEIEIHLHHGVGTPDTAGHTEEQLVRFRDLLAERHRCLSRWEGRGPVRYAFVHGNFALANSKRGRGCGVDSEMEILANTGCYADLTLPSAPDVTQVPKVNSLYECSLPLNERAPHRRGQNLRVGHQPRIFPLMIQGPLMLDFSGGGLFPHIENSALTWKYPATMKRFRLWQRAAIAVEGRPDWLFIKLHCHGMDPRDAGAMYGALRETFLRELMEESRQLGYRVHFTTAREMTNIILAACDGREENPGDYRDYRLKRIGERQFVDGTDDGAARAASEEERMSSKVVAPTAPAGSK